MAFFMAIFCCFERLDDQRERAGSGRLCQKTDESSTRYNTRHASSGTASQRNVLEQLRAALAQAIERIIATCPTAVPTILTERLNAIQHRIWAMHDALLTIRLPLENFYNSLTDEQQRRLRRDEPDSREVGANGAGERAQMCAEPAV